MMSSYFNFELFFLIFLSKYSVSQWSQSEIRQLVDVANQRGLEIERMTKEAAIRHNQLKAIGAEVSSRPTEPIPLAISPPIPPPHPTPSTFTPIVMTPQPSAPPAPTIEDDRTFLAKMTEQEQLVNQLNVFAAREAASRNDLLQMESSLLQALRPIVSPFMGQPIPGHFVPFQRAPRPIEESPLDKNIDIQSRPVGPQLPIRTESFVGSYGEEQNDAKIEKLATKNETNYF